MDTTKILKNLRPELFIKWLDTLNDKDNDMFICNLYYNPFSDYLHQFVNKDQFILCFYNGIGFYQDKVDPEDLTKNLVQFVAYDNDTDWIKDILEDLDNDVSKNVQDADPARVTSTTIQEVRKMADSKIPRAVTKYFGQGSHSNDDTQISRLMRGNGRSNYVQPDAIDHEKYVDYDQFLLDYAKTRGFGA